MNEIFFKTNFSSENQIEKLERFFYTSEFHIGDTLQKRKVDSPLVVVSVSDTNVNGNSSKVHPNNESETPVPPSIIYNSSGATPPSFYSPPSFRQPDEKVSKKRIFFEPRQQDTVFWCVYFFVYGQKEYDIVHQSQQHYGNIYSDERQKISAYFQKSPKLLKTSNYKVTNDMTKEIQSEFMVSSNTSYLGIIALSIYYKIRILLADEEKRAYVKFQPQEFERTCILYGHHSNRKSTISWKIRIDAESSSASAESEVLDSWFCKESYTKPLKPVSHYKIPELFEIAFKLGMDVSSMKKNEIYAKICEKFATS
jgi:hypothetical protein